MSLPFPQSKNHLLSVVDNLTYTERFKYLAFYIYACLWVVTLGTVRLIVIIMNKERMQTLKTDELYYY